jgi:hypothetical protein
MGESKTTQPTSAPPPFNGATTTNLPRERVRRLRVAVRRVAREARRDHEGGARAEQLEPHFEPNLHAAARQKHHLTPHAPN